MSTETPESAIAKLWHAGDLSWKLHETQETMRDAIIDSTSDTYVINSARRLGKTFLACTLAIEQCLQLPGSQVRYAAPTGKMVRKMVQPNLRKILVDCPARLRPEFNSQDGVWTFPNGSEIHIAGVNNGHADDLRGTEMHLGLIDEAGFVKAGTTGVTTDDDTKDELEYLVGDVLEPQLLTTDGRIILLSTPPRTPAHSFVGFCVKAEADHAYSKYTLRDAKHIPPERIERFIEKGGGVHANKVRREYFAEFVVDETKAVLPEFADAQPHIVQERERPPFFVPIIVADAGYHDHTFLGFGYHDFRPGIDYIEDEYSTNKTLARDIDSEATKRATALWGEKAANECARYVDAPAQVVAELNGEPRRRGKPWLGIAKKQTDGPFLVAATNDLRQRIKAHSTRMHPRCVRLTAHARNAVWRKPGEDYERMPGYGHFDGVAMWTYFTRLVDRRTNPFPASRKSDANVFYVTPREEDVTREQLKKLARRR